MSKNLNYLNNDYSLITGYDYSQHWSKRDHEDPRLAGKNHEESLAEFYHQVAQCFATESYDYYGNEEITEKIFNHILAREFNKMAKENLYGFGKFILSQVYYPIINDLWNRIKSEYERRLIEWWELAIQCNSSIAFWDKDKKTMVNMTKEIWENYENNTHHIQCLKDFGIEIDFNKIKEKEKIRVDGYLKDRNHWKQMAGGYWTGD
jgi:hypothetical protein